MHRLQLSLLLALALLLPPLSAFVQPQPSNNNIIIHATTPWQNAIAAPIANNARTNRNRSKHSTAIQSSPNDNNENDDDEAAALAPLSGQRQKAWIHAKKPLLRIGGKGATPTHGNSLRQLLDQHTVVKVKINTGPFDGSLMKAFEALKALAVESGAAEGVELIHIRTSDNVVMFGREGALELIDGGEFPPPPPPKREEVDGGEGRGRRIRGENRE